MKKLLITSLFVVGASFGASAQFLGELIAESMVYYFLTYDEVTIQAKAAPSLSNTYFYYGMRGGHSNSKKTFTGGMAFYYSSDHNHRSIGEGSYTNYYGGVYLEPKLNPWNKLHFSFPMTLGVGNASVKDNINVPANYSSVSSFWVYDQEILLNYRLGDYIQFHFGPSYKHVSGSNTYGLTDADLSGFSINAGIRLGNFME